MVKDEKFFRNIIDTAQTVLYGGNHYVGCLSEDGRTLKFAHSLGKYLEWLQKINIDETETLNLSPSASYTSVPFSLADKEKIERLFTQMLHAKKYFREYTENDIFRGLIK
jgi:hypothetical protein